MDTGNDAAQAESGEAFVLQRSAEVKDLGLGRAVKTYYSVFLPIVLVALLVIGTLVGFLFFREEPGWMPLAFGMLVAALGLGVCGFIYNTKRISSAVQPYAPDILSMLDPRQRRVVRRRIMDGKPLQDVPAVVARAAAVQIRRNAAVDLVRSLPTFTLILLSQVFLSPSPIWWLVTAGAVVVVAVMIQSVRRFLLTGRFLLKTA